MKRTQEFSSLGQQLQADNEIIAYIDGMAIVRNEWGNLFFFEVPEEYCEIGDVVESHYLSSIRGAGAGAEEPGIASPGR